MTQNELKALLDDMSLEEKLGQLIQVEAYFYDDEVGGEVTGPEQDIGMEKDDLKLMGSVLNCVNPDAMIRLQKTFMENHPHHIPLVFMQDVIHGYRTQYPIPLALAGSFNEELTEACAAMAAKEAALQGVHVTFAPMVDISRDARWGRCMESCGEDVTLTKRMGAAMVRGFVGDGGKYKLDSCVKHFSAYGAPEAGRDYNGVELTERTLRETYLPGYKAALDAGARYIMPSFNTIGNLPMTANRHLLTEVLRNEWGFEGVTISDYNAYREINWHGAAEDMAHVAELTRHAGMDMEMMSATTLIHGKELLESGRITMEEIDTSVLRILEAKNALGLFENPYRDVAPAAAKAFLLCDENRALAKRAAEESIVLLKNEGGLLPLSKDLKKIALVGPFADEKGIKGFWACDGRDEDTVSVKEGIAALLPDAELLVLPGCSWDLLDATPRAEAKANAKAAALAAKDADAVILCIGEYQEYSGEGHSRAKLALPDCQRILAEEVLLENPDTVVLVFGGRPQELNEIAEDARAIFYMWQPGTEGGSAAASLLFGDANPSGKLAMSLPYCVGQEPLYYAHQHTGRAPKDPTVPGINEPYTSNYMDVPNVPRYSFGYGLSYTTFAYSPVTLDRTEITASDTLTASVTVTNTGDVAGKEVVQFYIRDIAGSVARPVRALKDFAKLELQPGESRTVSFTIGEPELRYWNKDLQLASDPGAFTVWIGPDSDTENSADFRLV